MWAWIARPRSSTRHWLRRRTSPTPRCFPICCMGKKPGFGVIRPIRDKAMFKECAPGAQDHTHRRYRYKNGIDELERAKNRTKSSVRSKVEHVFQVMKLQFGFVKLRYRGLKKNAHRLFVTCALVNLFLSRRKLLLTANA